MRFLNCEIVVDISNLAQNVCASCAATVTAREYHTNTYRHAYHIHPGKTFTVKRGALNTFE